MAKKIRPAFVTLKREIWDGTKKVSAGTEFVDTECFEGKYQPGTADVEFENESPPAPEIKPRRGRPPKETKPDNSK